MQQTTTTFCVGTKDTSRHSQRTSKLVCWTWLSITIHIWSVWIVFQIKGKIDQVLNARDSTYYQIGMRIKDSHAWLLEDFHFLNLGSIGFQKGEVISDRRLYFVSKNVGLMISIVLHLWTISIGIFNTSWWISYYELC